MKIAVTGGNGMLGKDICNQLYDCGSNQIMSLSRSKTDFFKNKNIQQISVDCTNTPAFETILTDLNPEIIIHNAALVNLLECEDNYDNALAIHANVVKTIFKVTPQTKLIYISTDSVHNGQTGNYEENDIPSPLNAYSKSKYEGELLVRELFNNYMIIRTNIYGFHQPKGNSLAEWAIENLGKSNLIQGFKDVLFNPVYTKQFAQALSELIVLNFQGIINIGCEEFISKYDFLMQLNQKMEKSGNFVEATSIDDFKSSIIRPKNTTLNTNLLSSIIQRTISFENGIQQFNFDYNNLKNGRN